MRRGVVYSIGERLSVLTGVFPRDGHLEVLVEVDYGDHEISDVWFRNVEILEEDVVDVGVGVDGALRVGEGGDSMDQSPQP